MAYVNELNPASPANASPRKYGAKEMRSLSRSLVETFPNMNAPVTVGANQLNSLGKFIVGMILPFFGDEVPKDWALCDGTKGTPNLVGMFVKGASDHRVPWEKRSKELDLSNFGRVEPTKLTPNNLPMHDHDSDYTIETNADFWWESGNGTGTRNGVFDGGYTSYTGEGAEHTHNLLQAKDDEGNPKVLNVEPAHYLLKYIMYIGEPK